MKCAVCSTDNLPGAIFCSGCARKLSDLPVPHEQPDQNSDFLEGAEQKSPQPASSEGFMFAPGDVLFDRYRVISCVGKGGMGEVYRVLDIMVQKEFALKILQPDLIQNDKKAVDRFMREAAISLEVLHPHIVRMFDVDVRDKLYFLKMEYLSGNSLLQWMEQAQRPIPLPIILEFGIQLCDALDYAHKKGIIHRDIKPGNVIVLPGNQLKLLDFGIARLKTYKEVTSLGVVVGSIDYMAPERFRNQDIADERTDIYSLGAVLYELLIGRTPYRRFSLPSAYRNDIPAALDTVIDRALRDDPDERISSARELSEALQTILGSLPQTKQEKETIIRPPERKTAPPALVQPSPEDEQKRRFEQELQRTWDETVKRAKAGAIREAIAQWEQFLVRYPNAAKLDKVDDELNRLKKILPKLEAYQQRARQQEAAQDYAGAWQSWNAALELAPEDSELRAKVAQIRPLRQTIQTPIPQQPQTPVPVKPTVQPPPTPVQAKPIPQPAPQKLPLQGAQPLNSPAPVVVKPPVPVVQPQQAKPPAVHRSPAIKKKSKKPVLIIVALGLLITMDVIFLWTRLQSYWLVLTPPSVKSDFVVPSIQYPLVSIKAGTFTMGSPANEVDRDTDEVQHQVTLTRNFYIGATEVSQAQWQKIMGNNPSYFTGKNLPVENVSWDDVMLFCNILSAQENLTPCYTISGNTVRWKTSANGYRLPTEAEWEYACRAGTTTPFNTGENLTTDQANYDGNYPYGNNPKGTYREKTMPVDSFKPNTWGLYNMHGNVWEWCWDWRRDWWGEYDTSIAGSKDPIGVTNGSVRVYRGGSWFNGARDSRSAARNWQAPSDRDTDLGFRLARFVSLGT